MKKIKVGVAGLGQRGCGLIYTIMACEETDIVAVCDFCQDKLDLATNRVQEVRKTTPVQYQNFDEMLADKNVEVVVVSSCWDEHIRMAIQSMRAGKITAMEVGGAYDIEECWELVRTYEETKVPFMMLENCCFDKFELLSTSLARSGALGEIVHLHGAYRHDLRSEMLYNNYNYRLANYIHRNCENYPTHELGPMAKLANINRGNKMLSLVSVASKGAGLVEYAKVKKEGERSFDIPTAKQGDIVTTIITCANGETMTLTLDTTLPAYYSREFTVRGTKGLTMQETNTVLFDDKSLHDEFEPQKSVAKYLNNAENYTEYLPDCWRNLTKEEQELGHGGMDYIMFKNFFQAILNGDEMPVDVYDAASWMCVTALSEQSIAQGGAPQPVPDFTRGKWLTRKQKDVVSFPTVEK